MQQIVELITQAADQGEDMDFFEHIKGFLHPVEGYTLMMLAALGQGPGEVVEIGSYLGKSTSYLAMGLKVRGEGKVHAVDHFRGSAEHQVGQAHEESILVREGTLFNEFLQNLEASELREWVNPVVADSITAGRLWNKPIRLLFIDGDHSYEATRSDFQLWSSRVTDNGAIAFHDVGDSWPGVTRFHRELVKSGTYKTIFGAGSIRVVQRASR